MLSSTIETSTTQSTAYANRQGTPGNDVSSRNYLEIKLRRARRRRAGSCHTRRLLLLQQHRSGGLSPSKHRGYKL
jgi:hypothetical protein